MGEAAVRARLTPAEYLAFERSSEIKHEYADGEVFAMSGGTRAHSLISGNVLGEVGAVLRDRNCEVHGSDMRVKVPSTGRYVYPDASIVCGDFNVEPASETLAILAEIGLTDLVTSRGFAGTRTSYYPKPGKYADYMLVNSHVEVLHFDVVGEPEVSDHCPLLLEI